MRVAVYTDYEYSRESGAIYAERAFALFLVRLAERLDRMVIIGREAPGSGRARYRIPDRIGFVAVPYYESLARPLRVGGAMVRSLGRFWRALDDVDACWLLGPHPGALAFAAIGALRGRRMILGVRQDLPEYTRTRHPGKRSLAIAADALDAAWRLLARRWPTVVVGPALRRRYSGGGQVVEITVSLVDGEQIADPDQTCRRDYGGELTVLSVGRIEAEKNPLLLADVLAALCAGGGSWRLAVCGEGGLEDELRARLEELGIADRADLRGYVEQGEAMRDAYRGSHVLLHVSLTEGLPQVIVEALAAGLPVVATDVGGIGEAVGGETVLIPPADAAAAAAAVRRVASEPELRERLIRSGISYARAHTLDAEVERVAALLRF